MAVVERSHNDVCIMVEGGAAQSVISEKTSAHDRWQAVQSEHPVNSDTGQRYDVLGSATVRLVSATWTESTKMLPSGTIDV